MTFRGLFHGLFRDVPLASFESPRARPRIVRTKAAIYATLRIGFRRSSFPRKSAK